MTNIGVILTNLGRVGVPRAALAHGISLLCAVLWVGCGPLTQEQATDSLDEALQDTVGSDGIRSAVMWVDAPRRGLNLGFAHGVANAATGRAMTVDTPFLSASVGKLFVATAVLRLAQRGSLSLEDPLSKWLEPEVLNGLPVAGGSGAASRVTIRQLLSHRSGLPDYFSDASADGAPRAYDLIASDRNHRWSRKELLAYARAHYAPVGPPGKQFHYADTNYDLLGLVLERVEGKPFAQVVREQVLAPLHLQRTWYHAFEKAPPGTAPLSDVFIGEVNMQGAASLSADQAGGGLATTVGDLRNFLRSLAAGKPVPLSEFEDSFTEDAMHDGIDVGLSVWRVRPGGIFFALGGLPQLVGHSGSTGVWAYYDRAGDAVYVGSVNQSNWEEDHIRFLLSDVLPVVQRVPEAK